MCKELKLQTGRPSGYTDGLADEICGLIASGMSLRQICMRNDMPSESMVYRWLSSNDMFREKYACAREGQADFYADEIIEIADTVEPESAAVSKAKLMIDARKWKASKLAPKKYGERTETVHSGSISMRNDVSDLTDDELEAELVKHGIIKPQIAKDGA